MTDLDLSFEKVHVSVIVIDPDLKKVWLERPNNKHETDFWSTPSSHLQPGQSAIEAAYRALAPHEFWAKRLKVIDEETAVSHPSDKTKVANFRTYFTVLATIYTRHNVEHDSEGGSYVLKPFSWDELQKMELEGNSPFGYAKILRAEVATALGEKI